MSAILTQSPDAYAKVEPLPVCNLRRSDATAIAAPGRPELSYDQLADQIVAVGRALRGAGFERTDRLALVLPNGPEAETAFLSIAGSCVCAPLNPGYRAAELDFYLRDLRPKAIVVAQDGPATEEASRLGIDIIRLVSSSADPAGVFRLIGLNAPDLGNFNPPAPGDTALLLHTSGTTSRPKLVPLTWGNLGESAANVSRTLGLSPADRYLNIMPLFHIHGLLMVLSSLSRGASAVCTPGFLATSFFGLLDTFAPTWYSAVPTMHQSILARASLHPETLARTRLRFIRSASAALQVRIFEELESTFGVPVIEAYGMTEAAHQMASNALPPGVRKPGSVGPSAGPKISVRDDAGRPVAAGVAGRVCVAGANVTPGYLDNPKANQESFVDGWFYTGDLGSLDEDGYLFLRGRSKEIINRGGEKISPREIDEVLMRHPSVQQCLAFALPDSKLGEEVGAVIVLKPGAAPEEAAIQSYALSLLADFKVPRRIYFLEEIPKGPTGKPQRVGLAARLGIEEDCWRPAETSATPADEAVVARVSALMAEVLQIESAGPDTNFFDAGGDSLLGGSFLARLHSELQCSCTLVDLFQAPTPRALASRLSTGEPELEIDRNGSDKALLSFGQVSLWLESALQSGSLAYHRPYLIEMRGEIDPRRIRAALIHIVERHEPLRTTIQNHDGNPELRMRAAEPFSFEIHDRRAVPGGDATVMETCRQDAASPFRLDSDLPIRAAFYRLEDRRWWLLITIHHVATDGWSTRVLLRELSKLLQGEELDPLPAVYSDYARWQASLLSGGRLESLLDYWRRQLDGTPALLTVPADSPRPGRRTFQGKSISATLPPDLTAALRGLAQESSVTLFMVLLAGWKGLLARLARATDICVGVPVAGRARVEWEPLIGLFINTLALRTRFDDDPTFREIIDRVRETCLGGWSHQDLPFEKLVESLHPHRSPAHSPYFQVLFQLRNAPETLPDGFRQLEIDLDTVPSDLNLEITEAGQGLACKLFFNTALFTEQSAARILERFEVLLRGAAEAPETRLSGLQFLTAAERRQLLIEWNQTEVPYPQDRCSHQLFEQQVERTPEAIAVEFQGAELSYRELNAKANRLAHYLRGLGVGPETLVGVLMERSLEMVIALYAVWKAGGAYVPVDPEYPPERVAFMLQDANVPVLLTQTHLAGLAADGHGAVVAVDAEWERIARESAENPSGNVDSSNLAYVIYTSGSTGRPKGVMNTHRGIRNRLLWMTDQYPLTETDRVLQKTPFSFDVSVWEFFWPLLVGARLVVPEPGGHRDPAYLVKLIREQGITALHFVPSMLRVFLEEAGVEKCLSLRYVFCGGEALPYDLQQQFFKVLRAPLHNLYGPTEAAVDVTRWTCRRDDERKIVPIGRPIANTQSYILNASLQPVPIGVEGELCFGGDGLARGYLNQPELTAEKFIAHPFRDEPGARLYRTGDLARYLPDGNIEFLGRMDRQVKIRGFRIEVGEIEAAVQQFAGVSQCVVDAPEDAAGEKRLVAYVVPADRRVEIAGLRDFLKAKLPDYMVPQAFQILPSLPLTPNGKIDHKALPSPDKNFRGTLRYEPPQGDSERALARIWTELLHIERIGRHDNFFELGGQSLVATRVLARARRAFRIEIALRAFFESPTIAGLAERIDNAPALSLEPSILPVERDHGLAPSFAQERLWFLHQLNPESAAYNMPHALSLEGPVDGARLERCLHEILRRHEALRTRFETVNGDPVPVIEELGAFAMPITDLSHLPEAGRDAEASRLCEQEAGRPFDLSRAPAMRAALFRLGATRSILMLTLHHIAADGWSIEILLQELGALYGASGSPSALSALPVQYADYAVWQRNAMSGQPLEAQLSYWRKQLENAPAWLELPSDRRRPAVASDRGAIEEMLLPEELLTALKALSGQEGVTLFMTLLTAFQILLGRFSGQRDLTVAVPVAGRSRTEIESLIGFFVNMLVLRCDLRGDPTFLDLLRRGREVVLEAYAHQDLPFEKLIEDLRPERNSSYVPFCQVVFSFADAAFAPPKLGDLDLTILPVSTGTAKFDLFVEMDNAPGGLRTVVNYSTDLFDRETILRLLAGFRGILEGIAANPGGLVRDLPLTGLGYRKVPAEWNTAEAPYPRDRCVHQLFEQQAERTPEAIAVIAGDRQLTYRELNGRSNRVAHHLRELGVKPGDLIGLCVDRSPEMVVGLLGILKSGGAYVPLDPDYPKERLAFMLLDTRAVVVLTEVRLRNLLPRGARVLCLDADWEKIAQAPPGNLNLNMGAEDLAYVMYTSGSMGAPKGVEVVHRGIVRLLCGTNYVHLTEDDVFLQMAPLAFDASTFEIWGPLLHGGRLVLMPPEQPSLEEIGRAIRDHGVTTLWLTAGLFHLMAEERSADLKTLRQLLAGGDVLSPARVRQAFQTAPGCRLINGYGPTETTTFACCYTIDADTNWERPIPIGRPISNTQIYILNASLQPAPIGVEGELCIGGDGLARGYLNQPALTAEKFIAHPFSAKPGARLYRTGDLARYLPGGNIEFLGRMDRQVKIRGFRIELGEIEAAVQQYPGVSQCIVDAPEDAEGEKRLVAYVAPTDARLEIGGLRDFVKGKLPDYMVPAAFQMLASVPLTPNGKIDRKALPEPDESRAQFVGPRSSLELQLREVWERVLRVSSVGVRDNFFDLGGHSLLAVRLISEVQKVFHRSIPIEVCFQNPTIEGMAAVLEQDRRAEAASGLIRWRQGNSGNLFFLDSAIRLYPLAQRLDGDFASFATYIPVDPGTFALPSVEQLAAAHVALIRSQPRNGPCVLAGHSFGGVLAFEVAHQLQRQDHPVEMIVLLDSWAKIPAWWKKLKVLTLARMRKSLSFRARHLGWKVRTSVFSAPRDGNLSDFLEKVYINARENYKPRPLDTRAVLFRSRDSSWAHFYAVDDKMGWDELFARGLEIVNVPGDHNSLLTPPHLETVATQFQRRLEQIRRD